MTDRRLILPHPSSFEYITNSEFVGPRRSTVNGTIGGSSLKDGTSPQNRTQIYNLELPIAPANASVVSIDIPQVIDGVFALFNNGNTSNRNAINYGPNRDLFKEMYNATVDSMVKFRSYFSLTEWYNPVQGPYGFTAWPGTPPTNAFTNKTVEYTGLVNVSDFIDDIQAPQMKIVMDGYQSNFMWCDIGSPSRGCDTLAEWYNDALDNKEQPVIANLRCGCLWNGHSTPECE